MRDTISNPTFRGDKGCEQDFEGAFDEYGQSYVVNNNEYTVENKNILIKKLKNEELMNWLNSPDGFYHRDTFKEFLRGLDPTQLGSLMEITKGLKVQDNYVNSMVKDELNRHSCVIL